jgi:GNAT superfamily N-acetyltransferase
VAAPSGSVDGSSVSGAALPDTSGEDAARYRVRRIGAEDGPRLKAIRLAALADAPGDATTTLARAQAHDDGHWDEAASANATGGLQATFFAEVPGSDGGDHGELVGIVGAYANRNGGVNLVGLWSAPGFRDIGVASALLAAVAMWAVRSGAARLRLWVVERNEFARVFYEAEGFEPSGATMPWELDPRIRQREMVRQLR